ncbi:hypothetical protein ACL2XP_05475 [Sodalis sp. RH21]|uniref:hypothetical protein n=1 Tax=unclassified Sodalis (in: enterobacteria) TaxID=2636512 RepID=UPI0039B5811A
MRILPSQTQGFPHLRTFKGRRKRPDIFRSHSQLSRERTPSFVDDLRHYPKCLAGLNGVDIEEWRRVEERSGVRSVKRGTSAMTPEVSTEPNAGCTAAASRKTHSQIAIVLAWSMAGKNAMALISAVLPPCLHQQWKVLGDVIIAIDSAFRRALIAHVDHHGRVTIAHEGCPAPQTDDLREIR